MIKSLKEKEEKERKRRQKLLQISEISLWLYSYEDIFSDFDPRPYSQRALSEDFLNESKKITKEKSFSQLELKFAIPGKLRDYEKEKLIKKRLKDHFKRHLEQSKKEFRKTVSFGLSFSFLGIILMFLATFMFFKFYKSTLWTSFLITFLEPAGWFFFWEGLNVAIFEARKVKENVEFNEKMSKAEISFTSY